MNSRPDPETAPAIRLPTTVNARRLLWLRSIAIPGPALCMLLASRIYGLTIPAMPLILIVVALVAINVWTWRRLQDPRPFTVAEFFAQMLVDVAALTGILYVSGGAANPFAFFFLLPLTITATVLPRRYTWFMAAITACCYTFLMIFRLPVPEFTGGGQTLFGLHVAGMWLGFVLIAGLIAHYVAGMAETLREQDLRLAKAREQALNDERVLALGTLAAGAAHELGTPLATMSVIVEELENDLVEAEVPNLNKPLGILRGQIGRCKEALSVMSVSSGVARAETATTIPLGDFLHDIASRVRDLRPGAAISEHLDGPGPEPVLIAERRLTQAVINIVHNAVDASPDNVEIVGHWNDAGIHIDINDRGQGLDPALLQPGRVSDDAGKTDGMGVGLFISRAAIGQLGGTIEFRDRPQGGTTASVLLPAMSRQTGQAS